MNEIVSFGHTFVDFSIGLYGDEFRLNVSAKKSASQYNREYRQLENRFNQYEIDLERYERDLERYKQWEIEKAKKVR